MKMQQGIMGSNASPDLWISEKKTRSAELRRTFCDAEFRRKKTSRHPRENHQQKSTTQNQKKKPEDEFRRTIGLNTKFRRKNKNSRSQVHNLCSGVPLKNKKATVKSAFFFAIDSGSQDLNFLPILFFFQQISCPIIGRNGKKVHKVRRDGLANISKF